MFRSPAFFPLIKQAIGKLENRNAMLSAHPLILSEALEFAFAKLNSETFYLDVYNQNGQNSPLDHHLLVRPSDMFDNNGVLRTHLNRNDEVFVRDNVEKLDFGAVHLIYAFLIENTRTMDVFRKVVEEIVRGETLDIPSVEGRLWARAAEELFFSDQRPHSITRVTSDLRGDPDAVRRNAYYRLLGLELNYGKEARKIAFHKPKASNTEFVDTFERFLSAVWIGYSNQNNTSGANPTDYAGIAQLIRRLRSMLRNRRRAGALMREEYAAVCMASFFHATLSDNTPIIADLRCEAESPEGRLKRIGDRIGMPVHARSEYYFAMADAASHILLDIETDETLDQDENLRTFFEQPPASVVGPARALRMVRLEEMQTVITNWSMATGKNLRVQTSRVAA